MTLHLGPRVDLATLWRLRLGSMSPRLPRRSTASSAIRCSRASSPPSTKSVPHPQRGTWSGI